MDALGPYQPLNELARGGMGAVYRARDTRSGEHVALKVILDLASDLELLERFQREVTFLRDVEHPHLVRVLDADLRPPRPWAAFEFVEGGTLEQRVLRDGPLPWRDAVRIVSEIAAGVSAAHEQGLLHRDIKPANVLLGPAGAKLADFGLVKDLDRETLTQTGTTLGTPAYLAPEQAGAEKARWGPATDVYGLAATLFFALTGHPPFSGTSTVNVLQAMLHAPPPSPRALEREVPAWLDAICRRGMAKLGAERYPTAIAFRAALLHSAPAAPARGRWLLALVPVTALAGAFLLTRPRETSPPDPPPPPDPVVEVAAVESDLASEPSLPTTPLARAGALLAAGHPRAAIEVLDDAEQSAQASLTRGRALLALGRHVESAEELTRSLEHEPSAEAYAARAGALLRLGDPARAEADLSRALELQRSHHYLLLRGTVRSRLGRVADAERDLNAAIELEPRNPTCRASRAQLYTDSGRYAEALADMDLVAELSPRYALLYVERARVHHALGNLDLASADLDRAEALDPALIEVQLERCAMTLQQGDYAASLASCERALELEPRREDMLRQRLRLLADLEPLDTAVAHTARGRSLLRAGQLQEALQAAERAAGLDPNDARAILLRASVHLALHDEQQTWRDLEHALRLDRSLLDDWLAEGRWAAESGALGRALAFCSNALRVAGDRADLHVWHGDLLVKAGDPDAALAAYLLAIRLAPELEAPYLRSAQIHSGRGDVTGELRMLEQGLARLPESTRLRRDLALHHSRQHDWAGVLREAHTLLEQDPKRMEARMLLSVAWRETGRAQEALDLVEGILESEPEHAFDWRLFAERGAALALLGKRDEAEADFETARQLTRGDSRALDHLGGMRARALSSDPH